MELTNKSAAVAVWSIVPTTMIVVSLRVMILSLCFSSHKVIIILNLFQS